MRLLIKINLFLLIFPSLIFGEVVLSEPDDGVKSTYTVSSPLYSAICSTNDRIALTVDFTVYKDNIIKPIPRSFRRRFFSIQSHNDYALENADYIGATIDEEQIQKGHIYAHLFCAGSEHRKDVDCLHVIWPQFQKTNLVIAQLESHITEKAILYNAIYVKVSSGPGNMIKMQNADESCLLPSYFLYQIRYFENEDVDAKEFYEEYQIPNIPNPKLDFTEYKNDR